MTNTLIITAKAVTPSIAEATIHDGLSQHTWPCPNTGDLQTAAEYAATKYSDMFLVGVDGWSVMQAATTDTGNRLYVLTS